MGEHLMIDIGGAALEVHLAGVSSDSALTICAAHPAGVFGLDAARLLADTAQTRVVCVNPRGIGASSPIEGQSLEAIVDDVETVRQTLGVAPWVFWGMSGGGWLAQIYAHRHPEALTGIIVESSCTCFRERLADAACVLSPFFPQWRPSLAEKGLMTEDSHAVAGDAEDTEWIEVESVGSVFRRRHGPALLVSPTPVAPEMRRAMPTLWTFDSRNWLPTVRTPTLVLCGTSDPVVPVHRCRAVHEVIPGSSFVAIEGGGHVPTTAKGPEVAEAVRKFLALLRKVKS